MCFRVVDETYQAGISAVFLRHSPPRYFRDEAVIKPPFKQPPPGMRFPTREEAIAILKGCPEVRGWDNRFWCVEERYWCMERAFVAGSDIDDPAFFDQWDGDPANAPELQALWVWKEE